MHSCCSTHSVAEPTPRATRRVASGRALMPLSARSCRIADVSSQRGRPPQLRSRRPLLSHRGACYRPGRTKVVALTFNVVAAP